MRKFYTVTSFNTRDKHISLVVRNSENDAIKQIDREINLLKDSQNVLEIKVDYTSKDHFLAGNEHNAYCRTDKAEYYWKTDCIGFFDNEAVKPEDETQAEDLINFGRKSTLSFDYSRMTEKDFKKFREKCINDKSVYVGNVYIGDICIEILYNSEQKKFFFDYYILNEDTGYGSCQINDCEIPYDFAGGNSMLANVEDYESYESFIRHAEPVFTEFIINSLYIGKSSNMTLGEHAEKSLQIW